MLPRSPKLQTDSLPAEPQVSPRILEWVAYPFFSSSSQPRNWTRVSCITGEFFTNRAIREAHDKPRQHIKKKRHCFADKGPSSQSYAFSSSHVWMWELDHKESWAPKNRCFWTVVLRRLLRVPWTSRRSNKSILKEISPGCSLEGLMLKLKLQYFGHLMWRTNFLEKTLILGKIEDRRRRGWQRVTWLDVITD